VTVQARQGRLYRLAVLLSLPVFIFALAHRSCDWWRCVPAAYCGLGLGAAEVTKHWKLGGHRFIERCYLRR